ncbi:MAG: ribbon-helix-helix protein, CopG family [Chloroflexi bacterium]|nr:ribbon-helix-helix protein, CopG family [Chloroflexota bacterium]
MIRTQIQLTEEQMRRLKALAAERGVSLAQLIQESIDALAMPAGNAEIRRHRAIAVAGRFHSGKRDVSSQHDRYLVEAWEQ